MNYSITKKLTVGFGICVVLIAIIVGFNFTALYKLERLYQETLKRSVDMGLAADAQNIGEDLYLIIANAVINRDLAKSAQEWAASKKVALARLEKVVTAAETADEKTRLREAEEAIKDIIRIYEQDMLPLIIQGAKVPGPLSDIDARLDQRIDAIDRILQQVSKQMANKNRQAELKFYGVLERSHHLILSVSLLGVLAVIVITTVSFRQIVRPLKELTEAAQEMQNGNYLVEVRHHSDDEIGALTGAFRDMSIQVERRTEELRTSNAHLQREIGERRLADEAVRQLNAELEQRVERRTLALVKANEQLKQVIAGQELAEEELRTSREELRNLAAHLQSVREEECTRISREIHDELGQAMTALRLDVAWLGKKLRKDQAVQAEKMRSMTALIDMIIQSVQRISTELRPRMLDDLGLVEAIEWETREFTVRTGIACELTIHPADLTLDLDRSTTLFRIFQEALTNIARHAQASAIVATLEQQRDKLVLTIRDNGIGISENEISSTRSLGLIGIRERARLCDSDVEISGTPNQGTVVKLTMPVMHEGSADDQNSHRR